MAFGDFAIAPSTTVTLCAGVPLAKGSEDTILFGSAGEQASVIASYSIGTFSNITYQRNTRDVIRVEIPAMREGGASVLRANYCIFNNSAFEGKNIYCFVNTVDYVNNNTADIHFTIDAMQTFMFDYTLRECYVEREHSATDNFGENLVPENLGSFENIIHHKDNYFHFESNGLNNKYDCVIYYITNQGYETDANGDIVYNSDGQISYMLSNYALAGRYANNVYIGATCMIIAAGTPANGIDVAIKDIMEHGGSIVNIQMIPHSVITATDGGSGKVKEGNTFLQNNSFIENGETYYPKNKKLLTYPYCYLTVSNNSGEERQYRWEYFAGDGTHGGLRQAQFVMYGGYQPSPQCALVPQNYKNIANNYGEAVHYNAFPSSSWSEDSYLNWKLRNSNSHDASMNATQVSGAMGVMSGAAVGAAVGAKGGIPGMAIGAGIGALSSGVSPLLNMQRLDAAIEDAKATPDKLSGNAASSIVNEVIGCTGFTLYSMQVPNTIAKSLDDYFTMYGYATRRVKVPNVSSRPKFNYVKTSGCTIYGTVPAPFALEIQERFNNGVRFWKTTDVGNYGLNNSPS